MNSMRSLQIAFFLVLPFASKFFFAPRLLLAEVLQTKQDSRSGLRLCTQNIARLGSPDKKDKRGSGYKGKEEDLLARIEEARCDVIAVQEVYGESKEQAQEMLDQFASRLSRRMGTAFKAYVGESFDPEIRNGILVSALVGHVEQTFSLLHEDLPKLQPLGPASSFIRAPLAVIVSIDWQQLGCANAARPAKLFILTMHSNQKQMVSRIPQGHSSRYCAWRWPPRY
jgi:hypothetical protein